MAGVTGLIASLLRSSSWLLCALVALAPLAVALGTALTLALAPGLPHLGHDWCALTGMAWLQAHASVPAALPGWVGVLTAVAAGALGLRRLALVRRGQPWVPPAYSGALQMAGTTGSLFALIVLGLWAAAALGEPLPALWLRRALWPASVLLPWAFIAAETASALPAPPAARPQAAAASELTLF